MSVVFATGEGFPPWPEASASQVDGDLFKSLLFHLERNGGFDDVYVICGEPIRVKAGSVLHEVYPRDLDDTEVYSILASIWDESAQTILNRGRDIDFSYQLRPDRSESRTERYRYRGSATLRRSRRLERAPSFVMRSIKPTPPHISDVDVSPAFVRRMFSKPGLTVVAGETGSGKSTLLSSAVRYLVEEMEQDRVILTAEAPIEYVYDDVDRRRNLIWQKEVEADGFADAVRNALRSSPDYILVGEMRDAATVAAGIRASMTGHGVLATVHANNTVEIVRRMANEFTGDERVARLREIVANLRLAVVQYLARRTDGLGRVAIREHFFFDADTRSTLLSLDPEDMLSELAARVEAAGHTMKADAIRKHEEGIINDDELQFILAGV